VKNVSAPTRTRTPLLLALALAGIATACGGAAEPPGEAASVPHFAWVSKDVARGGQPKGEAAFEELARLGIRTVVSVDGARPDLAAAEKHGLRYVHIPFGYDDVPEEKRLQLAKTARELEGPFFVHCHHGTHRGPVGAVLAQLSIGEMSSEEAREELQRAGTAEKYQGLWACVADFSPPAEATTSGLEFDFPARAPVPELAQAMADLDRRFDHLKAARKAGWSAPADHPDIDPAHEALQVQELLVEMGRTAEAEKRPQAFLETMERSIEASRDLEAALRVEERDAERAEAAFEALEASCGDCHSEHRTTAGG